MDDERDNRFWLDNFIRGNHRESPVETCPVGVGTVVEPTWCMTCTDDAVTFIRYHYAVHAKF